jgi:iron complex outermembrane recepter protein
MKKLLLIAALFCSAGLYAQKIKGKVVDAKTNAPLSGATVKFAGKGGTTTANDGTFTVDCKQNGHVVVSFVGYENNKYIIKNCNDDIVIALTPSGSTLSEVEISATSAQNKSMLYQPVSITKLNKVELKRSTGLYFDDIINTNVPGVSFERRTVNAGQQFNIRGYGNGSRGTRGVSSNFDGQGYKVYLNNIPITDAEGITIMDDIDFGSIGGVEVVKGPAGSLYGLAIAGAVNLSTVQPEKGKTTVGQDIMAGSYGLQRYTTHFSTGGDRASLLVNYGHQTSDGYIIHNASHKDFINMFGNFQPNAKQTISAYLGFSDSYDERAGEQTIAQYEAMSDTGNLDYIKRNGHSHLVSFRAGLSHTYAFNNVVSNTTTIFGAGVPSDVSSAGGWTDRVAVNYGVRSTFNTKFPIGQGFTLSGITGVENQNQRATTIGYNLKKNPNDTTAASHNWALGDPYWVINAITSDNSTISKTTTVLSEWTLAMPHGFSFTAGLALSNMKVALNDRFTGDTITKTYSGHFDTTYKNMFAPHLALNKVFNKHLSVYASYSTGYKAPVSSYFFITVPKAGSGPTYVPAVGRVNSSLSPERGEQFEIGTKGSLLKDRLIFEVSAFRAVFSNKMTAVAVPNPANTVTLYTYMVNAGSQNDNGLEALVKYNIYHSANGFVRDITPFGNMTYSDFTYDNFKIQSVTGKRVAPNAAQDSLTTFDYSGYAVAGVPKFTGNLGFDFLLKYGVYGNFTFSYRDGMPITSNGMIPSTPATAAPYFVPYQASSYSLMNAKIGIMQSISSRVDIDAFVGVNNISSTQYPIMAFVNQIPDAYMPGPRNANYYGGLNIKFRIN